MSLRTLDISHGASLHRLAMRNASRLLAAYRTGSSRKRIPRCYLRPGMAHHLTLFMRGGSQTPPILTRTPSKGNSALSSSSRSASAETLDASRRSRKRPQNTLPTGGPPKILGEGGAHRLSHRPRGYHSHQDPTTAHHRLLRRSTTYGETKYQHWLHISRHGPQRQGPRLHPVQFAVGLAYGLGSVPPLRHH